MLPRGSGFSSQAKEDVEGLEVEGSQRVGEVQKGKEVARGLGN